MATRKVLEKQANSAVRKAEKAVKRAATAVRKSAKKAIKTADKKTVKVQRSKVAAAAKDTRGLIGATSASKKAGPAAGPRTAASTVSGSVIADRRPAATSGMGRMGTDSAVSPAPVTLQELKERARAKHIPGHYRMNKAALVIALDTHNAISG